jgi:hypothetical protein
MHCCLSTCQPVVALPPVVPLSFSGVVVTHPSWLVVALHYDTPPPPVCQRLHRSSCRCLSLSALTSCCIATSASPRATAFCLPGPSTPSTRRATTRRTSACTAPLHCPRASTLGFEPSCSGHDEGCGINDHSCRHCHCRHCRRHCHTGGGKTTNNEEGASHCYHVSRRRADKGREGQRSDHAGREALTLLKILVCHSVFLLDCDSLLGRG